MTRKPPAVVANLPSRFAATRQGGKLGLLVENGDYFKNMALDYAEGEKYAHLEREPGKPDLLADIFRPRVSKQ